MIVYRVAKTKYINDLSGSGARLYGGRWNHKGVGIIYASETRALATVEYLVHVPLAIVPDDLSIASIEVPDDVTAREILISELPGNWRSFPPPIELAELGTGWALSNETLLLRVPSAVVAHEFNILINPLHPDMKSAVVSYIENYKFDNRLLK
jgi:RES domain-containing protein